MPKSSKESSGSPTSTLGIALALTLALSLTACAGKAPPPLSVSQANSEAAKGYALAAGDKVKVIVFDEPNLTGDFQVGTTGELALPLIAPVAAVGRSPAEIAQSITAALAEGGYVLNPRVSVAVLEFRPVYVLGEVNKPGEYAYAGDLTYMQAIAKAGGFTPRADKNQVILQRPGREERLVRLREAPLVIAPGDTLIVRESFF